MQLLVMPLLLAVFVFSTEGAVLSKCKQVAALRSHRVPEYQMADWLCLIERESNGNTRAMNLNNIDGSWDWGLFQINDRYWCGRRWVGGDCNIACKKLRNGNVHDDIRCAKLIHSRMGFRAWVAWNNYCQGAKPAVPRC